MSRALGWPGADAEKAEKKADFPAMSSAILDILQAAAPAAAGGEPPAWITFMPFVGMAVIFWFLILRPQMRQQKAQRDKIGAIKRGDQVLTGGGFVGKVVKVDEQYAEIELAPNIKVKALKSTIADVVGPGGSPPAND
jgi:preprotein translocase subunit YajC